VSQNLKQIENKKTGDDQEDKKAGEEVDAG